MSLNRLSSALSAYLLLLLSIYPVASLSAQGVHRQVSLKSLTETIINGKVSKSKADIYYEFPSGRIITMNTEPEKYVYIANTLGEAKIYYPAKNVVVLRNDATFSARNNNLYYFFANRVNDLGLQDSDFKSSSVKQEESYTITTWQAPVKLLAQVDKIDLVHENMLPVYSEYRNTKGAITLKVYYSDFRKIYESMVPMRVTEIIYLNHPDSTIRRTTYSDVRTGSQADRAGFDFTIPTNARIEK